MLYSRNEGGKLLTVEALSLAEFKMHMYIPWNLAHMIITESNSTTYESDNATIDGVGTTSQKNYFNT